MHASSLFKIRWGQSRLQSMLEILRKSVETDYFIRNGRFHQVLDKADSNICNYKHPGLVLVVLQVAFPCLLLCATSRCLLYLCAAFTFLRQASCSSDIYRAPISMDPDKDVWFFLRLLNNYEWCSSTQPCLCCLCSE